MEDFTYATCAKCGAKNRIPSDRIGERPVCGRCKAPLSVSEEGRLPITVTDSNFQALVKQGRGLFMLDCWAPWCGPCRTISPVIESMARDYAGRMKTGKLNVDENPITASRYGIQSIPTVIFFVDGREADRVVGAVPRAELERRVRALMNQ
jgi:thioredoxin 2